MGLPCSGTVPPDEGLLLGQGWELLFSQLIGIVCICSLGFMPIYIMCKMLDSFGVLRSSEREEVVGIDMYLFKLSAYVAAENFEGESIIAAEMAPTHIAKGSSDSTSGPRKRMPPLQKLAKTLKKELNMPREASITNVIERAVFELEVSPTASTLQAKATACWKVLEFGPEMDDDTELEVKPAKASEPEAKPYKDTGPMSSVHAAITGPPINSGPGGQTELH